MSHMLQVRYKQHRAYWGVCDDDALRTVYREATIAILEGEHLDTLQTVYPQLTADTKKRCELAAAALQKQVDAISIGKAAWKP